MTHGVQNQSYVWGNSLISANGEDTFYYLQDHLGSPIRLLGEEQDSAIAYDEFGVPLAGEGKYINQPFGFTGYQTDDVTGLYYAQARYYAPQLGRFGAEDLLHISNNWYDYCGGNPIAFFDPTGNDRERNPTESKPSTHPRAKENKSPLSSGFEFPKPPFDSRTHKDEDSETFYGVDAILETIKMAGSVVGDGIVMGGSVALAIKTAGIASLAAIESFQISMVEFGLDISVLAAALKTNSEYGGFTVTDISLVEKALGIDIGLLDEYLFNISTVSPPKDATNCPQN
jgi:RHS repeat-associated protein